jgi:DNA-binding LytR/AlgR family response regulator
MNLINCVVADDEPIARKGILELIDKVDFLNVSGTAKDVFELEKLLEIREVDILFIDIEMPGISGIDFVKTYEGRMPLVVFTTAYPDYAVESYSLKAFDYLLKPVSKERFRMTADRAKEALSALLPTREKKDYFFVRCDGRYEKLIMSEIVYISGMQNYIKIHFSSGKTMVVHSAMKSIFRQLDESRFIMVHKSYIVNLDYIASVSGSHVSLTGLGQIPIGRHFKASILPRLYI